MRRPAEVISSLVEDHTPADDAMRADQGDLAVDEVHATNAVLVKLHVAQIADVAVFVVGVSVVFLEFADLDLSLLGKYSFLMLPQ